MSRWAWASSTGNFDLDGFDLVDYRNQFAPVTTAEGLVVEAGGIQYARYVRFWAGANTKNRSVHFLGVGIKGAEASTYTTLV